MNTTQNTTDAQVAIATGGHVADSKPKRKAIFNITPLTNVSAKASKTPKKPKQQVEMKYKKKLSPLEMKYKDVPQVNDGHVFPVNEGSIQEYLNLCHKDLRTFIYNNEISSVRAEAGALIVITKNKFRVVITISGKYERTILIKDSKGTIVYNGKSSVTFGPDKKAA